MSRLARRVSISECDVSSPGVPWGPMAQVDSTAKRLELKVIYWGPSRGGKTTTVRSLYGACEERHRGELSSVETEDERTYFFDYAPMDLPRYKGFAIRVHCYTVPGQE